MAQDAPAAEATISDQAELDTLREGVDDPQVLKQQLAKEAQARRQITARAIKAEGEAKAEREARIKLEESSKQSSTLPNQPSTPTMEDERLELRLDGYSKEEVNYIMANGGRQSLDDKNSYTSIAINTRREQLKAENAANQVPDTSGLADIEKRVDLRLPRDAGLGDLRNSVKEMEKILPHAD